MGMRRAPAWRRFESIDAEDTMPLFTDNPALRSQLESQVDFLTALTSKAVDTVHQLSELNMKLARQNIEAAIYSSRELLACGDPAQMAQVAMKQLQPANERWRNYQQQLMNVLAGVQADFAHSAEERIPAAARSASAAADEMVRHAATATPAAWHADEPPTGAPH
jgi:phasin family protein